MEVEIGKEVNLLELYTHALTEALQTNFTLTEAEIDRIHKEILRELKTKCQKLVKEGLITNEDIFIKLEYQVGPILQEAKRANEKRQLSWNAEKINGLYNGFPCPYYEYKVVDGGDNDDEVAREIRRWLCDYGNFCCIGGAIRETVGCNFDKVKEDLKVQKLLPEIFTSSKTSRSINEVNVSSVSDIIIHPIEMKLFAHDPNAVEMVKEGLTLSTWKMICPITRQFYFDGNTNIEFVFPCYSKVTVNSTVEANITFKVTKEYKVSKWIPLSRLFNTCPSITMGIRVKLIMCTPDSSIKLRKRVTIEISKEQADKYMTNYKHFKDIKSAMASPHDNTAPSLLPSTTFIAMHERFPWLLFIEKLRRGGVKAAMEMVNKKPHVLKNLLGNENNVLGITFEELQITKIMAEAIRKNVPIELIAGDGNGTFIHEGNPMRTPEYVDAVFRNTDTNAYFAVQFKYADTAEHLIEMMQDWNKKWTEKSGYNKHPKEMHLENVQLIGPNDVSNTIKETNKDIGMNMEKQFKQSKRIGFKYPIDDTETLQTFLGDNKKVLKDVVELDEYTEYRKTQYWARKTTKIIKSLNNKLSIELQSMPLDKHIAQDKTIPKIKKYVKALKKNIAGYEQTLQKEENKMKSTEERFKAIFESKLNVRYRKRFITRDIQKDAALNVVVMVAVDGITAFVCTFGDEWKDYHDGRITIEELVKVVRKETVIAAARGTGFGVALSGLNMVAQYAAASNFAYGGALTTVSKVACPIVMAGMFMKQSYDIIKHWNAGDITTAEMEKAFGRSISTNGLSIAGMMVTGTAIGGPLGLVVGAGFMIAVGVGDYFLGNKLWSCVFKEDKKEADALMERKINDLYGDVLNAAYDLLGLTEYSTREEIKEKYRLAIRNYHPDKGGSAEIFHAVHAAYTFICNARKFDCDK